MGKRGVWVGVVLAGMASMVAAQERQRLPTVYEAGHFYATPTLADGRSLRLLVDTGGGGGSGWYVMARSAASRLGLKTSPCKFDEATVDVVEAIPFRAGQGLPASIDTPCRSAALVIDGLAPGDDEDGQLGAGYLPGRLWTFDYPARALWLERADWKPQPDMHRIALDLPRNAHGRVTLGMGRIALKVDGQSLDLLLDTGATAKPTDAGKATAPLNGRGVGVTSYITTSVLDRWHRAHPSWRVIEHGDGMSGGRLIEVPEVEIAGWRVGPIWFTERLDANFVGMSNYTDQPVTGAAGGNIFQHFRMTLDYPAGAAWFACITDCRPAD
ncbi:hypothetical protein [Dyella sedimenti]|uniref:hypothetical protein n=1 Tax=Dyella sedimenti TaxID=2919947 RepID=UPI001FA95666|nr:hypothetical protein [Dyella sedimenti]